MIETPKTPVYDFSPEYRVCKQFAAYGLRMSEPPILAASLSTEELIAKAKAKLSQQKIRSN
jgi:hypothetical protein